MEREPFVLIAIPGINGDRGEGYLEFVTFEVQNSFMFAKWSAVNIGTFVEEFSKIVPQSQAIEILNRLRAGKTVQFPGLWALDDIKSKLGRNRSS
jgi:hypothetical protein